MTMYAPPPPQEKKRFPLWAGLLLGCGCLLFVVPAILAAILFPVFAQARDKARSSSCLSNIKQTGLATMMYSQDWDETFPHGSTWMTQLQPYTKTQRPFHCPVVSHTSFNSDSQTTYGQSEQWDGIFGYAYNSDMSDKQVARIQAPNTTPLIYDSSTLSENVTDSITSLPAPPRHSASNSETGESTGNAMGFADGHAKFIFGNKSGL